MAAPDGKSPRNGGHRSSCNGQHNMAAKKEWPVGRNGMAVMVEQKCNSCDLIKRTLINV